MIELKLVKFSRINTTIRTESEIGYCLHAPTINRKPPEIQSKVCSVQIYIHGYRRCTLVSPLLSDNTLLCVYLRCPPLLPPSRLPPSLGGPSLGGPSLGGPSRGGPYLGGPSRGGPSRGRLSPLPPPPSPLPPGEPPGAPWSITSM